LGFITARIVTRFYLACINKILVQKTGMSFLVFFKKLYEVTYLLSLVDGNKTVTGLTEGIKVLSKEKNLINDVLTLKFKFFNVLFYYFLMGEENCFKVSSRLEITGKCVSSGKIYFISQSGLSASNGNAPVKKSKKGFFFF